MSSSPTGLGWPVSRETPVEPTANVSRETSTGLGWPSVPPQLGDSDSPVRPVT